MKKNANYGCESKKYPIMGYPVYFPESKKPFPAQFAVMSKILTALKNSKHALLESPTGSGKTLALLCSTMSWQMAEIEKSIKEQEKKFSTNADVVKQSVDTICQVGQEKDSKMKNDPDDDDFEQADACNAPWITKKRKLPATFTLQYEEPKGTSTSTKGKSAQAIEEPKFSEFRSKGFSGDGNDILNIALSPAQIARKTPKIYFASRTHTQLAQVIAEFRNSPREYIEYPKKYNMKMTVLGSKKHYCVNPSIKDKANVNEACTDKLNGRGGCRYRDRANELDKVVTDIWDIEDIVDLGANEQACPYFYSRQAVSNANIIFCPYNYLLNPSIRRAMNIDLTDAIVVLDEAHNIEDVCRESSSLEVTVETLEENMKVFADMKKRRNQGQQYYSSVEKVLQGLLYWMGWAETRVKPRDYEVATAVWSGSDAIEFFQRYANISSETIGNFEESLEEIRGIEGELKHTKEKYFLPESALNFAMELLMMFGYLLKHGGKHKGDYKVVVMKKNPSSSNYRRSKKDQWRSKLCCWCMNPGTAFADLTRLARSVVLSSGTLSPMDSFSGELATAFPVRLEANHVINTAKQLWVGAISSGPGMVDMVATYKNQQNYAYQDSLGEAILRYLQVIPGGVLVFLPSYSFIEKVMERWMKTNIMSRMEEEKEVFVEPKSVGVEFDELLESYRTCIKNYQTKKTERRTGALLIAVYRGKISEGIDFPDDLARAVVIVGIPYPNVKDLKIELKQTYQSQQPKSRQLLDARTWYAHQAFRALNQALGRCIRHRNDYGAVILLDSRFTQKHVTNQLSKWIRNHVNKYTRSDDTLASIEMFFDRLTETASAPVRTSTSVENEMN